MATPTTKNKRSTPNIAWTRPEYGDALARWNLIRDCVAGSAQVKKRGEVYLPRPNLTDTTKENQDRYEQYKQRAVFYNLTGRTLQGLVGQVMAEDPHVKLPASIAMLEGDVDGSGVEFQQQAAKTLSHVLAYSRAGLWVDYPTVDGATTQAQLKAAKVRPTVMLCDPWDIINWRMRMVDGRLLLCLVVISEQYVTDDDGFEQSYSEQWRVLSLDDDGDYVVEEWIVDPKNKDEFILKPVKGGKDVAQYYPLDSQGKPIKRIPFTFVGAVNNDPNIDLPLLYDIADLNIAHYRNSADYEESCYIVGQPTPVFTGLTEDWVKDVLKGVVQLGSRGAVALPVGGAASLLQVAENSMPKEAMVDKERQMVSIGAKIVQQREVQRTATEANNDQAAETSVLAAVANNVSCAYELAFNFALMFVDVAKARFDDVELPEGQEAEVEVELNTSFTASRMSSADRAQLIAEWMSGAITDEEMRLNMTRAGVASEDFDAWKTARDEQLLTKPVAAPAGGAPQKGSGQPPPQGGAPAGGAA